MWFAKRPRPGIELHRDAPPGGWGRVRFRHELTQNSQQQCLLSGGGVKGT